MDEKDIEKKLLPLVKAVLPRDPARPPLSRATKLQDDPAIDSLTMASLGFSINESFGIEVDDLVPMLAEFHTVDDAVRLIKQKLG
jgi:acyl carrier protein